MQPVERNLAGQVAFVSGSGRGLGRAMAERLAAAGADVCLHDISEEAPAEFGEHASLADSARKLEVRGVRVAAVVGDISDPEAVERMKSDAEAALGPVTILVNCAGGDIAAKGGKPNPNTGLGIRLEDVHALLNRNFVGTLLLCQAFGPSMVERGSGSIINIASAAAHFGTSPEVVYSSIKAAIVHLTRCLAFELRPHGVRVNCVSPGATKSARFVNTRVTDPAMMEGERPLIRYCDPADIAEAVAFLASEASRMVNGQVIRVDGGATLYPG